MEASITTAISVSTVLRFHRELSCRFRLLLREEARVHPGPGLHQADLSSLRRVRRLLNTVPGRCIGEGEP